MFQPQPWRTANPGTAIQALANYGTASAGYRRRVFLGSTRFRKSRSQWALASQSTSEVQTRPTSSSAAASQWLTSNFNSTDQIVLIGESLGGDAAIELARAISPLPVTMLATLDPVGFAPSPNVDPAKLFISFPNPIPELAPIAPTLSVGFDSWRRRSMPTAIPFLVFGRTPSAAGFPGVPSNVENVFNRYQTNGPFPMDFAIPGNGLLTTDSTATAMNQAQKCTKHNDAVHCDFRPRGLGCSRLWKVMSTKTRSISTGFSEYRSPPATTMISSRRRLSSTLISMRTPPSMRISARSCSIVLPEPVNVGSFTTVTVEADVNDPTKVEIDTTAGIAPPPN